MSSLISNITTHSFTFGSQGHVLTPQLDSSWEVQTKDNTAYKLQKLSENDLQSLAALEKETLDTIANKKQTYVRGHKGYQKLLHKGAVIWGVFDDSNKLVASAYILATKDQSDVGSDGQIPQRFYIADGQAAYNVDYSQAVVYGASRVAPNMQGKGLADLLYFGRCFSWATQFEKREFGFLKSHPNGDQPKIESAIQTNPHALFLDESAQLMLNTKSVASFYQNRGWKIGHYLSKVKEKGVVLLDITNNKDSMLNDFEKRVKFVDYSENLLDYSTYAKKSSSSVPAYA